MSLKPQAPKDLVVQRLVLAADEIFALFERTFAQYEEDFLRNKCTKPTQRGVLPKEDFLGLSSGLQSGLQCGLQSGLQSGLQPVDQSELMSVKTQALKDLVVERLVVAADEISVLFERTFAEYEEEFLRSKYLQTQQEGLYKKDMQSVIAGLNDEQTIKDKPIDSIKQEVNDNDDAYPSFPEVVKSEEKNQRPECDEEEPGCSNNMISDQKQKRSRNYGYSDRHLDQRTTTEMDKSNPVESSDLSVNSFTSITADIPSSADIMSTVNQNILINPGESGGRGQIPKCSLCYKTFKSLKALARHLEFHPGPFRCEVCQRDYTDRSNYKKHLRIHSEQKPFRCSVCERGFTQKRHMNEHMRIHTGEKPLTCAQCGMTFRQKNSLMRHVLSKHSEDKPYACPVCLKGFVQKWHLVVHMRGHTGERPFTCSVCGKSYESKCYLKKHMERSHNKTEDEDGEAEREGAMEGDGGAMMDNDEDDLWSLEPLCPGPQPPLLDSVDTCI